VFSATSLLLASCGLIGFSSALKIQADFFLQNVSKRFKEQEIVQSVKINRPKWLEYIRRMDESLLCRKLTFTQLEGSTKKGRPKLRWLDDVLQDLKILKVTAWWKKAVAPDKKKNNWEGTLS
jgi:hypothetical protein